MTAPSPARVRGPRTRDRVRGALPWIAILVGATLVALLLGSLSGANLQNRDHADPENPAPPGARALAQVLEREGIRVTITDDPEIAQSARGTLVVQDPHGYLTKNDFPRFSAAADRIVLLSPSISALQLLTPAIDLAGQAAPSSADTPRTVPGCDVAPANRAGSMLVDELYRGMGAGSENCFTDEDGSGLVSAEDGRIFALGQTPLTNENIVKEGHAALALGLLGTHEELVWFRVSADSLPAGSIGQDPSTFAPAWAQPVVVLLLVAALTAMLWRGRRFGPLVAEQLPVVVPANETTLGRGRMYLAARDQEHAAQLLRAGTQQRLRARLRLAPSTDTDELVRATAALLGAPRDRIDALLNGPAPFRDDALVHLAQQLTDLENAVRRALDPTGRITP